MLRLLFQLGDIPAVPPRWTLTVELDPTWPGNDARLVRVVGFLTSSQIDVVPGLPPPSQ